ncbi:MAG TPA: potassium channel family protein [Actinomycetes bacterium]|nr:potassium channel family protein [Actinomycetes bacterium]
MSGAIPIGLTWATVARSTATTVLIGVLYAVLPVASDRRGASVVILVTGLIVLGVVIVVRIRQLLSDPRPVVRAIEALSLVIPLFLTVFAWSYLSLSSADPSSFTEPLDKVAAIYFTIVVTGTVGFGDITPHTDLARLLVSGQIVLGLTLFTAVVRVVISIARERSPHPPRNGR